MITPVRRDRGIRFRSPKLFFIATVYLGLLAGTFGLGAEKKFKRPPPKGSAQAAIARGELTYLGPGADVLSPEQYQKRYGDYIKEAIRVGFPPEKCEEGACELSIKELFRKSGLYDYPLPGTAGDVKVWKNAVRECYRSGGAIAQVNRDGAKKLTFATVIFSKSPKAMPSLWRACQQTTLRVLSDAETGLEKLAGIPVGYPHPYLCAASQGLFIRSLNFADDRSVCRPVSFRDNAWSGGKNVSEDLCFATQQDVEYVWQNKLKPNDFVMRERKRTRERMRAKAKAHGTSRQEADQMFRTLYQGPLDNDFTYVGVAMRNLESCNQYIIGGLDRYKSVQGAPVSGGSGSAGGSGGGKSTGAE